MIGRLLPRTGLMLALLVSPGLASGQASGTARRVGIIYRAGYHQAVAVGLREGLRSLGLEEGKQYVLEVREVSDDLKASAEAAKDLEQLKVDLLVAVNTQVTREAKQATSRVPIVFYSGADPVAAGFVASLARPGGRLTGVHGLSRDLTAKRLEILKRLVPRLQRVVTFYSLDETSVDNARIAGEAAGKLGVQLLARQVDSAQQLRQSLQALSSKDAQAYFHSPGPLATGQAPQIIEIARAKRWPTMFHETGLVDRGALAAYGQNYHDVGRLLAKHVQRILAGAATKDVPVEKYDKVGLALNLRTARELGLTIPPAVRALADTVVE